MKKLIVLSCAFLLAAATLTACGNTAKVTENVISDIQTDEKATDQETDKTADQETIFTMGFDASFPPYGYRDEAGEYVGFDMDLAAEVCARNGWELVKQPVDWDSKDMELSSGTIDCIWNGFTISDDRKDKYTWSKPYVDNSQVFVVGKDSGITKKEDLADKVVVVQADSSALEALNGEDNAALKASFKELIQVPEYNTAFMNLEAGAVDAVAMDIGVAHYQMESRGDGYVIMDDTLATEVYGIGFLLGNETLRDQVQTALDEMKADGKFLEIATKWDLQDSIILD